MKLGDWRVPALLVVLVLGALLAWSASHPPRALGEDAPETAFSAARAMIDDRAMAAKPHPIGSAEAGLVRSYLLQRMQFLGLQPRLITGEAVEVPKWFKGQVAVGGRVENLVGVLKGTDPSLPAVAVMAHSDSVPASPGAADDAAGVSSALEAIRALKAMGRHRRDVAVVITDGEEAGLLGARGFFASDDPLVKHIGEIVNLEARGGGGRVAMFQTGPHDGPHIALFARAVGNSNANSLTSEVYKYMPNDTDFTVSRDAGLPGYNFAFIGTEFDYHSPSSTPEALDKGALQHMGDQALGIVRALADASALPRPGADAAYSDILGHGVIAYPAVLGGWLLLILSVGIAVAATVRGQRLDGDRSLRPGPMLWGAVGTLLIFIIVTGLLWAAGQLAETGDVARHRRLLAQYPAFCTGFMLLTVGIVLFCVGPVQRGKAWTLLRGLRETRWSSWLGSFLVLALVCLAALVLAPPTAMLVEWPMLAAALIMGAIALSGGRFEAPTAVAAVSVIGLIAVAHMGHFADQTFEAVGSSIPEMLSLLVLAVVPVLYPLLTGWGRAGWRTQVLSLVVIALGAGFVGYAALHKADSARTPMPVQAFFLEDSVTGKSWRATTLDKPDPWTAGVLGKGRAQQKIEALNAKVWATPAPDTDQQRPKFVSSRDGDAVVIRVIPQAGGRELRMALKSSAPVKALTVDGQSAPLLKKANDLYYLRWSAAGDGVTLRFIPVAPGELNLYYAEIKDGWPAGLAPGPKPKTMAPMGLSDTTIVIDELKTKW